ncbi:MAG: thiolase family protein [Actinomycetia bacterium]|nr:thiolase family protein [Actinomycetes bacterium]
MRHPFHDVAITDVFDTPQARVLEGHTTPTIILEAAAGLLDATGVARAEIDGVIGPQALELTYSLGLGPVWTSGTRGRIQAVIEAASLIAAGVCRAVLIADGRAGVYVDRTATAPWTRPDHELIAPFGMYTAVHFAMVARHHMETFGTTPEDLASVAATIRNNGHVNPDAVYFGRGPFTAADILASRMVADPFHVLDCAMTAEGGAAMLLTRADRAQDLPGRPVYLLGGGGDAFGREYAHPPRWNLTGRSDEERSGYVGSRAAKQAFAMAGLGPGDVDCCELYDAFSFEIIRQLEAFGFCGPGEGAGLVADGFIAPGGACPATTDGGLLSYSHNGAQMLQRVGRGVHQLRGVCRSNQVEGAEVVLCSNGGAGAMFTDVLLLGVNRP